MHAYIHAHIYVQCQNVVLDPPNMLPIAMYDYLRGEKDHAYGEGVSNSSGEGSVTGIASDSDTKTGADAGSASSAMADLRVDGDGDRSSVKKDIKKDSAEKEEGKSQKKSKWW